MSENIETKLYQGQVFMSTKICIYLYLDTGQIAGQIFLRSLIWAPFGLYLVMHSFLKLPVFDSLPVLRPAIPPPPGSAMGHMQLLVLKPL